MLVLKQQKGTSEGNRVQQASTAELLNDIVEHIWIDDEGNIGHLRHSPISSHPKFIDHLQRLSAPLRQQYLTLQLRDFLLDFYFVQQDWMLPEAVSEQGSNEENGEEETTPYSDQNQHESSISSLANHFYKGLDIQFYDQLVGHNTGVGYFDSDWQVIDQTTDKVWVQKDRLTVVAERELHLAEHQQGATTGDRVALLLPSNQIEAERYQAIGNRGVPQSTLANPVLQVFLNLQATDAAHWIGQTTTFLNQRLLPFQLQVFNLPDLYEQRGDAGILEISRCHWPQLQPLLEQWLQSLTLYPETLPFTAPVELGISVAEAPLPPIHYRSSQAFALHRCGAIAQALVQHPVAASASHQLLQSERRWSALQEAFATHKIHWQLPHLNRNSVPLSRD